MVENHKSTSMTFEIRVTINRPHDVWPPNIDGAFYSLGSTDGVFFLNDTSAGTVQGGSGYLANWTGFDAARSSNLYQKDATMQPKALSILPCIRA